MKFSKKHTELLMSFSSSLAHWGAAGALGTIYFTDWRCIVTLIPFYNGAFVGEPKTKTYTC
ncbi:hypothetical protein JYU34_009860 [Plutella xylostella]|uniref:Uncharacterized protein n=1 Tax=Plutella xylostella TaxID=51655 RepID=A0ABQ7QKM9_PLUXY|nr:hypothetical protein JYU34_009860 [Plutella xylostella]